MRSSKHPSETAIPSSYAELSSKVEKMGKGEQNAAQTKKQEGQNCEYGSNIILKCVLKISFFDVF